MKQKADIESRVAGDKGEYLYMCDGSIWLHPWTGAKPEVIREPLPGYNTTRIAAIGKRHACRGE